MQDYLGSELRDLAHAFHARVVTDLPLKNKVKADRHVDSSFVLKGILKSRHGGLPMSGRTQGTKQKPYRYYHISTACRIPSSDGTMRRTVLAEPIERAVLKAVRETLLHAEDLRPRIEGTVRQQIAAMEHDSHDQQNLRSENDKVTRQIEFVIEELSQIGKDAARVKIQQLEQQLRAIDERLTKATRRQGGVDVAAVTDQIVKRISDMGSTLDQLPSHGLRSVLSVLISRLEVDMETLTVELELALPHWAMLSDKAFEVQLGLGGTPSSRSSLEAQSTTAMIMAVFDCNRPTKDCYDCRRRAA